jgi:hypothetical protein
MPYRRKCWTGKALVRDSRQVLHIEVLMDGTYHGRDHDKSNSHMCTNRRLFTNDVLQYYIGCDARL